MPGVCGFAGLDDKRLLGLMCRQLEHGSNTSLTTYADDGVCLAGTSVASNKDESIVLAFDGELYNSRQLRDELSARRIKTDSCSEPQIIAHLYGESGVSSFSRLNRVFSFALWDKNKKTVVLARDPVGVKTMYYTTCADSLLFSSEMKSIVQYPGSMREIDGRALNHYLSVEHSPTQRTLIKGVKKLLPAQVFESNGAGSRVSGYWDLTIDVGVQQSEGYYVKTLRKLLEESMSRRLSDDMSFGSFLSGGMDSSSVVALAAKMTDEPVKTFSMNLGVEGSGASDDLGYARLVSQLLGTEHHEMCFECKDLALLPHVIWTLDDPITGVEPYLMREFVGGHADVVFTGRGGDELFGGQDRSRFVCLTENIHPLIPEILPRISNHIVSAPMGLVCRHRPEWDRYGRYIHCMLSLGSRSLFYKHLSPGYVTDDKQLTYSTALSPTIGEETSRLFSGYFKSKGDYLNQMLLAEAKTKLSDLLCSDNRLSTWNNIVERAPMVDVDVVKFSFTIPASLKVKNDITKYVLRKAMSDILPREVVERTKGGGFVHSASSLLHETNLGDTIFNTVSDWNIISKGYFRQEYIKTILKRPVDPRLKRQYDLVLFLAALEVWNNIYVDSDKVGKPTSRGLESYLGSS